MLISGRAEFGFAAPIFLALIALFMGNKETPIQVGDYCFTVRPLRLALLFLGVDVLLFLLMWLAGVITF